MGVSVSNVYTKCPKKLNIIEYISCRFVARQDAYAFLIVLQHLYKFYPDMVLNSCYPTSIVEWKSVFDQIAKKTRSYIRRRMIKIVRIVVLTELILDYCEWKPNHIFEQY